MRFISDLHLHGPYAQATSKALSIPKLEQWARVKGLDLLGTGDFTHPKWVGEIRSNLKEDGTGLLRTESGFPFMLTTELSLIYTDKGKGRRVHLLTWAPDLEAVDRITQWLLSHGRVDYDGRPIFKISCRDFVYNMGRIDEHIEVIPAHIWTPWFGVLGSKSGYDSMEAAFGDQLSHVHAAETGMSSDPEMNWRLSSLDRFNLVSFSDSHSFWPWRIGREATLFECGESYEDIVKAVRTGDGLAATVETDPGYGRYHFDGHRNCNVSLSPSETARLSGICPSCGKPLTIGVLSRVEELADRDEPERPKSGNDFWRLIPLSEIIAAKLGASTPASKQVWEVFNSLVKGFGSEYEVLLKAPEKRLSEIAGGEMAEAILMNREGRIEVVPGFDGEYGRPVLGVSKPKERQNKVQKGLGDFF